MIILGERIKEYRLREALQTIAGDYDFCIIDTPPALGILTINALTACDGAIIPAQAADRAIRRFRLRQEHLSSLRRIQVRPF